jgi:hypothetical protein
MGHSLLTYVMLLEMQEWRRRRRRRRRGMREGMRYFML